MICGEKETQTTQIPRNYFTLGEKKKSGKWKFLEMLAEKGAYMLENLKGLASA